MRPLRMITSMTLLTMTSAGVAHGQWGAWGSAGFGVSQYAGGITRLALSASLSRGMITVRHSGISSGLDRDGSIADRAVLLGLRTRGASHLSASIGAARARHTPESLCSAPCAPSPWATGHTDEIGAHTGFQWASLGLVFAGTRASRVTHWQGLVLSVGVGKLR